VLATVSPTPPERLRFQGAARIQMLIAILDPSNPSVGGAPSCKVRGSSSPLGRQSLKTTALCATGATEISSLGKVTDQQVKHTDTDSEQHPPTTTHTHAHDENNTWGRWCARRRPRGPRSGRRAWSRVGGRCSCFPHNRKPRRSRSAART